MLLVHDFYQSLHTITKMSHNSIAGADLSPPQAITLIVCKNFFVHNGVWPKPSQISDILDVTPASVTPVINKLEDNGYVEREYSKTDRREVYISLTAKGEQEWNKTHELMKEYFERMMQTVGEENIKKFIEFAEGVKIFNQQESDRKKSR